jgi:hypothetical protein
MVTNVASSSQYELFDYLASIASKEFTDTTDEPLLATEKKLDSSAPSSLFPPSSSSSSRSPGLSSPPLSSPYVPTVELPPNSEFLEEITDREKRTALLAAHGAYCLLEKEKYYSKKFGISKTLRERDHAKKSKRARGVTAVISSVSNTTSHSQEVSVSVSSTNLIKLNEPDVLRLSIIGNLFYNINIIIMHKMQRS